MKRPKPLQGFKKFVSQRRRPAITEVVREATAGGVIFRHHPKDQRLQILLVQDAKDRWTIPKGHIEPGEAAKDTARREIQEETGLKELNILNWLGKVNFRYRRQQSLVLITMHVFLVRAKGDTDSLKPEDWMNGIKWFDAAEAVDAIEYEDIGKLILIGLKKIRQNRL
jgi:ADP-ribose pyrophosphatase YjhB (NUDIX family)